MSERLDVLIIGAGFAGLYAIHRARRAGLRVHCVEAGDDVGGTWYWNRYPGARCDVDSIDYSYSFDEDLQQEWRWTERYATQPEILSYIQHVTERFDLRRDISFGEYITDLEFTDDHWTATSESGNTWSASHVIAATGSLSAPHRPDIPGVEEFAGEEYFTAQWPHDEPDLTGKRVGVIGTGSSGIQSIPLLAERADHLTVFQRTPNYSVPAFNRQIPDDEWQQMLAEYPARRAKSAYAPAATPNEAHPKDIFEVTDEEREAAFEAKWQRGGVLFAKTFNTITRDPAANALAADFAARKIRAMVDDPAVAEALIPTDHPIGTKRICTDTNYYATYNRDNVELVNLRADPIDHISADGIHTRDGFHPLDVIVWATGFDAMTGSLTRMNPHTSEGTDLASVWGDGPVTYLAMGIPGLPNFHPVNGPGGPAVLANMVTAAEQQVDWIIDLIEHCREHGIRRAEATAEAATKWTTDLVEIADQTLFPRANSWYTGANIEGKKRTFMLYLGGFGTFRTACDQEAEQGYPGYVLTT